MKNNIKTYVFLIATIIIWGMIGKWFYNYFNPEIPELIKQDVVVNFNPEGETIIDTFSIQTTHRDPFLGTLSAKQKFKKINATGLKKTSTKVVWIPILYHGVIAKQNSKEKLFVMSIEGQQQFLKIGQELKGVKLISATNKEVTVSYKGAKKTVVKL